MCRLLALVEYSAQGYQALKHFNRPIKVKNKTMWFWIVKIAKLKLIK